ncbi:MAG: protein-L-isoaspartate(D-aspartate) O-methyltransferase [Desulfurivibrionaceae bacterium]|nr:protein-L-isoaspartate(D-aspartate) O-methyltransferase [Pseudomonadota bacterium]MCG2822462.1 protein-L-isoaspartate(D-aspartate) O-methyltransferase [Desulfobulbaceae bacterium]MDP2001784.1 protein-L-isoaspartate(D-aspartate) O-methyltransferase [Desulfurivibrionaceae bacterium]PKN16826.1 MAG: protein-L-isoaspartate O-methyltransferase [Deltaproteobacteria bacterium HGW-Deltaproteobacteria-3]MBU4228869.1 protein-L-isoaspartate(D-aspartate) O-methyltransferase [Pseudomonadota bacterium]
MSAETIQGMLRTIEDECRFTGGLTGRYTLRQQIFDAMAAVRREDFVPDELKPYAYDNNPLPIGNGQTISQPFIVALMTDLLEPEPGDTILEIGTGSGYQAAVLSQLVSRVYSLEIVPELARQAADRLRQLGYDTVEVIASDGSSGLPEHAPYDGIIVTAAAPRIPQALIEQLSPFGRLVIPVGRPHLPQDLLLVEKSGQRITSRSILSVAFVPFTGHGQD